MRNLLNSENLKVVNTRDQVEKIINKFSANYKYNTKHVGDDWGYIKFNGVSCLEVDQNLTITVSGFGFNKHPKALLRPYPGCGDVGYVVVADIKEAVNLLAQYDKIYPL